MTPKSKRKWLLFKIQYEDPEVSILFESQFNRLLGFFRSRAVRNIVATFEMNGVQSKNFHTQLLSRYNSILIFPRSSW